MAVTEELLVKLRVDANGAIRGTKVAVDGLKGLGNQVKRTENVFQTFQKRLEKIFIPVTALNQAFGVLSTVTATLGRAVDATLGNFARFETALIGVQKTTELGGQELQDFGKTIQDLSEDIPVSANQLLKFAEIAGQLGVRGTENLENFAETMAKIEVSTNLAGEEAAKQFTRILTVTKEGIENIDEFASVIVRLGNNFAANEQEITRVTTEVARSIGIFRGSAAEAAALATALRVLGNRAELGGTVVGRVFRAIDSTIQIGTDAAKKNLSELTGIAVEDLRQAFEEDASGAFVKFLEGLRAVEKQSGSIDLTLQQFKLTGDEVNKVIPALTDRLDVFRDTLNQANEEAANATALNEEAERAFSTLASSTTKLVNTVRNLGVDLGRLLAPAATAVVNIFRIMLSPIGALIDILNDMQGAIAILAGSGGLALLITKFSKLVPLVKSFKLFMMQSIAPAVVLAGKFLLFATAIQLVIDNAKNLGKLFQAVFDALGVAILWTIEQFAKLTDFIGLTENATETMSKATSMAFEDMNETISDLDTSSLDTMTELGFKLADSVGLAGTEIALAGDNAEILGKKGKRAFEETERSVGPMISEVKDAEKAIRDLLRAYENLIKATKELEKANAVAFKTGRDAILTAEKLKMAEIDGIEAQLKALDKLKGKEEGLRKARAAVREETRIKLLQLEIDKAEELFETNEKNINDLLEGNKKLEESLAVMGMSAEERSQKKLEFALADLELLRTRLLLEDESGNNLERINKLIEKRKALLKKEAAGPAKIDLGDVGNAIKAFSKAAIDPETYVAAFKTVADVFEDINDFNMSSTEQQSEVIEQAYRVAAGHVVEAGEALVDLIAGITLEQIGEALVSTAQLVADIMSGIISGQFVTIMTDVVNAFTDFPSKMLEVFSNFGQALLRFAESFPQLVANFIQQFPAIIQQIIDAIPMVVDALVQNLPMLAEALVSGIVRAIPVLAQGIADALPVVFTELAKGVGPIIIALTDAIPVIIEGLMKAITEMLPFLVQSIVLAFQNLLDRLPDIVDAIIDNLPALVEALVEAAVVLALKFVEAVIEFFFTGGAERIIVSIIKVVPKLILAIANGLANALRKVFGGTNFGINIGGNFGEFEEKIVGGVKRIADEATGVADELFKVVDARNAAQKSNFIGDVNEAVDKIATQFDESGDSFGLKIKQAWDNIIRFFKEDFGGFIATAWHAVLSLFQDLGGLVSDAWKSIMRFFGEDFGANISDAWKVVWENLKNIPASLKKGFDSFLNAVKEFGDFLNVFATALGKIGTAIFEQILKPIGDVIATAFTNATNGIAVAFNSVKTEVFDPITSAFSTAFNDLKTSFDGLFKPLEDAVKFFEQFELKVKLPEVNISGGGGGTGGFIGKVFGLNEGGLIPDIPGFSEPGVDSVPTLLTPGEFVLNRGAAQSLGPNVLNSLNQGRLPGAQMGSPIFNIDLKVDAGGQPIDDDFIRSRLVPRLMDAIKEQSLDGRFVMSLGGLR